MLLVRYHLEDNGEEVKNGSGSKGLFSRFILVFKAAHCSQESSFLDTGYESALTVPIKAPVACNAGCEKHQ